MTYPIEHDNVKGSGDFVRVIAGEDLGNRKLVYLALDETWKLADADAAATMPAIGLTMHAFSSGTPGWILTDGWIGLLTWTWTPGEEIYASTTVGELTQTAPASPGDLVQIIGIASTATQIKFSPNFAPAGEGPQYADAHISAGGLITIDTTLIWHAITGFVSDDSLGVTFNAGATGAITVFANPGGGQVTVTSAGHPLVNGDIVTIAGTTNYNGIFEVSNVAINTFEITSAFNGNDGVGTWRNGSSFVPSITAPYMFNWQISASSTGNAKAFIFTISVNATIITAGIQRREFAAGGDIGAVAGSFICECSAGDIIAFNLQNETDATNITLSQATMNIHRLS